MFRECALRELREEVGIIADSRALLEESFVMTRTVQGTKLFYFGMVEHFVNSPEILEPNLIDDIAWFPISELPEPFVPHHRV